MPGPGVEALREALGRGPLYLYSWDADSFIAVVEALAYGGMGGVVAVRGGRPSPGYLSGLAASSRRFGGVALVGLGWLSRDVDLLAGMVLGPVAVVDVSWDVGRPRRPNVVYANPSPRGDPGGRWPGTAYVLAVLLEGVNPLLAAAGIVARLGVMARANRAYQNMMARAGLDPAGDFQLAWDCAMQAYGIAAAGDPQVHAEAARSIVEADPGDPCRALLRDALAASLRGQAEVGLEEASRRRAGERSGFRLVEASGWGWHLEWIAREEAAASPTGRALVVYEDQASGLAGVCAWSVAPRDPALASIVAQLRRRKLPARGVYQGPANYVCVYPSRDPWTAVEAILESLRERYSSVFADR